MSRLLSYTIVLARRGAAAPDLTPPADLTATTFSATRIDLAWGAAAPGATHWSIERSLTEVGGYAEIDEIAAPATSYSNTGLTPATEYFYRVRAKAGDLYGAYSNVDSDTTPFVGAFDGITFAALYGLKRYLTAYTGPLIKLRRDSNNDELDFGDVAATGLLDTAAIATWLGGANGYIVTWYDQSGNARDVTQATAAAQPAYVASGQNGLPTIRCDGSNDYLAASGLTISLANPTTILAMNPKSFVNDDGIFSVVGSNYDWDNADSYVIPQLTGANRIAFSRFAGANPANVAVTATADVFVIMSGRFNSGTASLYKDGGTPATDTYGDTTTIDATRIVVSVRYLNSIYTLAGQNDYAAAMISDALSTANHNTIGNELATLYGLSWNTVS